jgi:hypothetical protein
MIRRSLKLQTLGVDQNAKCYGDLTSIFGTLARPERMADSPNYRFPNHSQFTDSAGEGLCEFSIP